MTNPKKVVILGSTGEIGRHALSVVDRFPDNLKVVGLSNLDNSPTFQAQLQKYQPQYSNVTEGDPDGLEKLAAVAEADLVVVAVVGKSGLKPTIAAIEAGHDVALATKEVLVLAGQKVMKLAEKKGVQIIPIDSELSAMYQSLKSGTATEINKVYLTMGFGKIAQTHPSRLENISPTQVLTTNHWKMGPKIMIDSATCVNKIFEAIEAAHFFNLRADQIQVVVHPEYFCHSMVEFVDGSIIGEFGEANMERYLQYALLYPERLPVKTSLMGDLLEKKLTFLPPDYERFPVLNLIPILIDPANHEMNLPAIFHGADEILTTAFVAGQINFVQIGEFLIKIIQKAQESMALEVETDPQTDWQSKILQAEAYGQKLAQELIEK